MIIRKSTLVLVVPRGPVQVVVPVVSHSLAPPTESTSRAQPPAQQSRPPNRQLTAARRIDTTAREEIAPEKTAEQSVAVHVEPSGHTGAANRSTSRSGRAGQGNAPPSPVNQPVCSAKQLADNAPGFNGAQLRVLKRLALNLCPPTASAVVQGKESDDLR